MVVCTGYCSTVRYIWSLMEFGFRWPLRIYCVLMLIRVKGVFLLVLKIDPAGFVINWHPWVQIFYIYIQCFVYRSGLDSFLIGTVDPDPDWVCMSGTRQAKKCLNVWILSTKFFLNFWSSETRIWIRIYQKPTIVSGLTDSVNPNTKHWYFHLFHVRKTNRFYAEDSNLFVTVLILIMKQFKCESTQYGTQWRDAFN